MLVSAYKKFKLQEDLFSHLICMSCCIKYFQLTQYNNIVFICLDDK